MNKEQLLELFYERKKHLIDVIKFYKRKLKRYKRDKVKPIINRIKSLYLKLTTKGTH